jgi:hypothetical protein
MARQKPADAAKAKAAKQKKIVIGLCVFLALAMAYAVSTMMKLNGGGGGKPVAAAPSSAAVQPTAATPAASTAVPTAAPTLSGSLAVAPVAPVATDASGLISAIKPPADTGQLESFSRFDGKDPFADASLGSSSSSGKSGSSSSGSGSSGSAKPPKTPPAPPTPPAPVPTSAVISINNVPESVVTGSNFPSANPTPSVNGLFNLRSLTATTATVAIVGGSYASGSSALTLKVNKPVTLVNTADGTRYTLMLNPQGTVAAASAGAATAAPTGSGG